MADLSHQLRLEPDFLSDVMVVKSGMTLTQLVLLCSIWHSYFYLEISKPLSKYNRKQWILVLFPGSD